MIGTDYQEGSITTLKDYKLLAISRGLEQIEYKKQYKDDGKSFQINYNYTYTLNNFNKNNIISNSDLIYVHLELSLGNGKIKNYDINLQIADKK